MVTLFAIPKPFDGHIGVIQRNAIRSWARLTPRCEIILFGDDAGTRETAAELGLRHEPDVARNEYGTPLVDDLFARAEQLAGHETLCYVNADIILMGDFLVQLGLVVRQRPRFLVVGQRWDLDVTDALEWAPGWEARLRRALEARGRLHGHTGIDYFAFCRGLWGTMPPFAIGRTMWDNWLIFRARSLGVPVIDATAVITAVHQNHGYAHHPDGADGVWTGPEARRNVALAGGQRHAFLLLDADWVVTARGLERPPLSLERVGRRLASLAVLKPQFRPWVGAARVLWAPVRPVYKTLRRPRSHP